MALLQIALQDILQIAITDEEHRAPMKDYTPEGFTIGGCLSPQKGSSRDHEIRASDTCRYWKKNVLRADVSPSRIVDHAKGTQSAKIIGIGAALRRDSNTLGKHFFGDGLRVDGNDLTENPCLGTGDDLQPCL